MSQVKRFSGYMDHWQAGLMPNVITQAVVIKHCTDIVSLCDDIISGKQAVLSVQYLSK